MVRALLSGLVLLAIGGGVLLYRSAGHLVTSTAPVIGAPLDSLNGVVVYYNGGMGNVSGRNVVDGYNVGIRYQCVEFVKRCYLEHYGHRMPNSYGHARDMFTSELANSAFNASRGLIQIQNGHGGMPQVGDLLVLAGWTGNPYGHVAIVCAVENTTAQVIQQNTGSSRQEFDLDRGPEGWQGERKRDHWLVTDALVQGWSNGAIGAHLRSLPREDMLSQGLLLRASAHGRPTR